MSESEDFPKTPNNSPQKRAKFDMTEYQKRYARKKYTQNAEFRQKQLEAVKARYVRKTKDCQICSGRMIKSNPSDICGHCIKMNKA